jgi:hypothetical protein
MHPLADLVATMVFLAWAPALIFVVVGSCWRIRHGGPPR